MATRPPGRVGGRGSSLLQLLDGWTHNPDAFARPSPPPEPQLPLKFTCARCGEKVHPKAERCSRCRESFNLPNSRNRRFKRGR